MSQLELQLGPMFVELVWITGGIDLLFAWELRCFLGENSFWPGWMRCRVGRGKGGCRETVRHGEYAWEDGHTALK